jgi:hypothetical protein
MATPLKDRQGGLQLPHEYRTAIVDIVKIWTNNHYSGGQGSQIGSKVWRELGIAS